MGISPFIYWIGLFDSQALDYRVIVVSVYFVIWEKKYYCECFIENLFYSFLFLGIYKIYEIRKYVNICRRNYLNFDL